MEKILISNKDELIKSALEFGSDFKGVEVFYTPKFVDHVIGSVEDVDCPFAKCGPRKGIPLAKLGTSKRTPEFNHGPGFSGGGLERLVPLEPKQNIFQGSGI